MTRCILPTFGLAAVGILVAGAGRRSPIVLVAAVTTILAATWAALFVVFLALGGVPETGAERRAQDQPGPA